MGDLPHQNRGGRGPATGYCGRAQIVPLPLAGRGSFEAPRRGPGHLVYLSGGRDLDAQRNQAWDELLVLVDRAWSWRDPESLAELEAQLLQLGVAVEVDWI